MSEMANHHRSAIRRTAHNYSNLKTVPALLGILFGLASLFLYGAFGSALTIEWFDWMITTDHAAGVSLIVLLVAFMSSKTRRFEDYADWEKVLIGLVVVLSIATGRFEMVDSIIFYADPWTPIVAFLVSIAGYGTAVR